MNTIYYQPLMLPYKRDKSIHSTPCVNQQLYPSTIYHLPSSRLPLNLTFAVRNPLMMLQNVLHYKYIISHSSSAMICHRQNKHFFETITAISPIIIIHSSCLSAIASTTMERRESSFFIPSASHFWGTLIWQVRVLYRLYLWGLLSVWIRNHKISMTVQDYLTKTMPRL